MYCSKLTRFYKFEPCRTFLLLDTPQCYASFKFALEKRVQFFAILNYYKLTEGTDIFYYFSTEPELLCLNRL